MTRTVRVSESRSITSKRGKRFRRREHTRHLYSVPSERGAVERDFEKRYGKRKGKRVYGATVGKVRREQVAKGTRSSVERVKKHRARYPKRRSGRRRRGTHPVRAHRANIRP